ncbi:unnamed protein product [Lactuca saligna]|uniref:Uncharacterized protein n=1 Tax=Lactuca saligna TaxID=75948 RepID=A0AA35Z8M9_LACSI|nr:unnamed protein product [Lactuca saligna]
MSSQSCFFSLQIWNQNKKQHYRGVSASDLPSTACHLRRHNSDMDLFFPLKSLPSNLSGETKTSPDFRDDENLIYLVSSNVLWSRWTQMALVVTRLVNFTNLLLRMMIGVTISVRKGVISRIQMTEGITNSIPWKCISRKVCKR